MNNKELELIFAASMKVYKDACGSNAGWLANHPAALLPYFGELEELVSVPEAFVDQAAWKNHLQRRRRYVRYMISAQLLAFDRFSALHDNALAATYSFSAQIRRAFEASAGQPVQVVDIRWLVAGPDDQAKRLAELKALSESVSIVIVSAVGCVEDLYDHPHYHALFEQEGFSGYQFIATSEALTSADVADLLREQTKTDVSLITTDKSVRALAASVYKVSVSAEVSFTGQCEMAAYDADAEFLALAEAENADLEEERQKKVANFAVYLAKAFFSALIHDHASSWTQLERQLLVDRYFLPRGGASIALPRSQQGILRYLDSFTAGLSDDNRKSFWVRVVDEVFREIKTDIVMHHRGADGRELIQQTTALKMAVYLSHEAEVSSELSIEIPSLERGSYYAYRFLRDFSAMPLDERLEAYADLAAEVQRLYAGLAFDEAKREGQRFFEGLLDQLENLFNQPQQLILIASACKINHASGEISFIPLLQSLNLYDAAYREISFCYGELQRRLLDDDFASWPDVVSELSGLCKQHDECLSLEDRRKLRMSVAFTFCYKTSRNQSALAEAVGHPAKELVGASWNERGVAYVQQYIASTPASKKVLSPDEALVMQQQLLAALDEEGGVGLVEFSLKSQLDQLIDQLEAVAAEYGDELPGLAFFDWDETQRFPHRGYGYPATHNIMPHEQWAKYFNELKEAGIFPVRLTTRSRLIGEGDDVHGVAKRSGVSAALFGDLFACSGVVKADAMTYVYKQLEARGVKVRRMTLLEDQPPELLAARLRQKQGVPLHAVEVDREPGMMKTLKVARTAGCFKKLDQVWLPVMTAQSVISSVLLPASFASSVTIESPVPRRPSSTAGLTAALGGCDVAAAASELRVAASTTIVTTAQSALLWQEGDDLAELAGEVISCGGVPARFGEGHVDVSAKL